LRLRCRYELRGGRLSRLERPSGLRRGGSVEILLRLERRRTSGGVLWRRNELLVRLLRSLLLCLLELSGGRILRRCRLRLRRRRGLLLLE
jgi:hypothetical protein